MSTKTKEEIEDLTFQFIVLVCMLTEKIESLEEHKLIPTNLKSFIVNSKKKYLEYINKVFKVDDTLSEDYAFEASAKVLFVQDKIEKALKNEYVLTEKEREDRVIEILKKYLSKDAVPLVIKEIRKSNAFRY